MKKQFAALALVLLFIAACSTVKVAKTTDLAKAPPSVPATVVKAEDMKVEVDSSDENIAHSDKKQAIPDTLPIYRATTTLTNDILHTKIDVHFDYKKQHVLGKVWITAKPYF